MAGKSRRSVGRPKEDILIKSLRARAWYRACVLATGATSPDALAKLLGGSRRNWERYAAGNAVPSLYRKENKAIAALVGEQFPQTRRVLEHPLWVALAADHLLTDSETDQQLLRLDKEVWGPFFATNDAGEKHRRWGYLRGEIWEWPDSPALIMDYVASYLFLLKEARVHRDFHIEKNAEDQVHLILEKRVCVCPTLSGLATDFSKLVRQRFLDRSKNVPRLNQIRFS